MIQDKILYSIFLPAIVPIEIYNNALLLAPLDKGTCIYVLENKNGIITNCKNEQFLNEIKKIYKKLFKEKDKGLYLYYETPITWEFNTFYNTVVGISIANKVLNKEEIIIKNIIKELIKFFKNKNMIDLNLRFYINKGMNLLTLSNFSIKKIDIDTTNILIISITKYIKNFKLLKKEILKELIKEKLNDKAYKIVSENCDFIVCKKRNLVDILEKIINGVEPEKILISRIYKKGIQVYFFK